MTVPNPLVVLGVPTEGRSASMSVLTMAHRVTVRSVTRPSLGGTMASANVDPAGATST